MRNASLSTQTTPRLAGARVAIGLSALAGLASSASAGPGLLSDGSGIVAWGRNNSGQVSGTPTSGVFTDVAGGWNHSLALRSDGSIVAWGDNGYGQVSGTPSTGVFTQASTAGGDHSLALRADGSIAAWGQDFYGQVSGRPTTGVFTQIAAGMNHSLALRSDGSIAAWGYDFAGQVSGRPTTGVFTQVATGGEGHSLALRSDGSIAAWGYDYYGQVSGTPTSGVFTQVAGGGEHSLALRSDGSIAAWGDNSHGQVSGAPASGVFTQVAGGGEHSLALRADGSIVAWGGNGYGQVSGAPTTGVYSQVAAGWYHSLALIARTSYDGDLLITGKGPTATLNRSVNVAGGATLQTAMTMYNNPALNVAGTLNVVGFASASGSGIISASGLAGSGDLGLQNGAQAIIPLHPTSSFTGALNLGPGASLALTDRGLLTPSEVTLAQDSELQLQDGQRVTVRGDISNSGRIELLGNDAAPGGLTTFQTQAALTNSPIGLITGRNAILHADTLASQGTVAFTGGVNDVFGNVNNTGALTSTGGAVTSFYDTVINNGVITVSQQGTRTSAAVFLGLLKGSGSITGGGDVFIEGGFAPGNSPAMVSVDADLTLGAQSSTEIELAGLVPGTYDQVNVNGDLTLGGTLSVAMLSDFEPFAGETFNILTTTGTLSGTFDGLADGAIVGTFGGVDLQIDYLPTGVQLQAIPEPTTASMLLLAGGLLCRRRRCRRNA